MNLLVVGNLQRVEMDAGTVIYGRMICNVKMPDVENLSYWLYKKYIDSLRPENPYPLFPNQRSTQ